MNSSEKLFITFGAIFFIIFALLLLPVLTTIFGAFSGFVVGIFFDETILGFFSRMGFNVSGYSMWKLGAALGFVSGFFAPKNFNKKG